MINKKPEKSISKPRNSEEAKKKFNEKLKRAYARLEEKKK